MSASTERAYGLTALAVYPSIVGDAMPFPESPPAGTTSSVFTSSAYFQAIPTLVAPSQVCPRREPYAFTSTAREAPSFRLYFGPASPCPPASPDSRTDLAYAFTWLANVSILSSREFAIEPS